MFESVDSPRKPLRLKTPLIVFAISVGAIVVGSAVCLPGICGCASWIGLQNTDSWGTPFMFLTMFGVLGVAVSTIWLAVIGIRRTLGRNRGTANLNRAKD
jgi:hypothetical protein